MITATGPNFRYRHLADEIRGQILAGVYGIGQQLDTVDSMIARYGVGRNTVCQAMRLLEEEGLINRSQGRGTFVADRAASGEVGIVINADRLDIGAAPSYAMGVTMLMGGSPEHPVKWKTRLHLGQRPLSSYEAPSGLDLLNESVLKELRGVVTFQPLFRVGEALKQRRIPVILLSLHDCGTATQVVWFDLDLAYRQIMTHLKEVGCHSVGVIWDVRLDVLNSLGGIIDRFRRSVAAAGLITDPRWMVYRPLNRPNQDKSEQGGWELFHEFWHRPGPRPDAIFSDDEYVCRGILRAAAELGVRLGKDLKLVTMATEGVELPSSLQVTRMDYSMANLANTAILSMERLLAGQLPTERKLPVPPRLTRGQTT